MYRKIIILGLILMPFSAFAQSLSVTPTSVAQASPSVTDILVTPDLGDYSAQCFDVDGVQWDAGIYSEVSYNINRCSVLGNVNDETPAGSYFFLLVDDTAPDIADCDIDYASCLASSAYIAGTAITVIVSVGSDSAYSGFATDFISSISTPLGYNLPFVMALVGGLFALWLIIKITIRSIAGNRKREMLDDQEYRKILDRNERATKDSKKIRSRM